MAAPHKTLIIADDTPEFPAAALYAGLFAKAGGGELVLLCVVEPPAHQHWVSVGEAMREEALDHAAALARRVAGEICAGGGQDPTIVIREGEPAGELRRLLDEDSAIGLVVLGAGSGRDGPGPLVTLLARAGGWGGRAVPVLVVPGALSTADVRALTPGPRPDAA